MLRCISVFFVVFICWACEVDYSFGEKDFKPRVVVNALISPQEPFAVRLHWSRSLLGPKRVYSRWGSRNPPVRR